MPLPFTCELSLFIEFSLKRKKKFIDISTKSSLFIEHNKNKLWEQSVQAIVFICCGVFFCQFFLEEQAIFFCCGAVYIRYNYYFSMYIY